MNNISKRKHILIILGILVLGFGLRLWGINNPVLDFHSWRQSYAATVARNFCYDGMNIFAPRENLFPGFRELEFPIYPYIVAILYKVFGFKEWLGRFVSILFSMGSLFFFYLFVKKFSGKVVAEISLLFMAMLPMTVYYGRTFMPESAMLFFSIAMLYYLSGWIDDEKGLSFFLAVFFASFAYLVKITTLYMLFPVLFLFLDRYGKETFCRRSFYLYLFLSLLPAFLWYYHTHQGFLEHGTGVSIWEIGKDKWGNAEILSQGRFYRMIFLTRLGELMFPYAGYPLVIVGLFLKVRERRELIFRVWFFAVVLYFFVVARGNLVHEYYQIAIIPAGTVFMSRSLIAWWEKLRREKGWYKSPVVWLIILLLAFIPVYSVYRLNERLKVNFSYKIIGELLGRVSDPHDYVLVFDHSEPEVLYYSDRRGWHTRETDFTPEELEMKRKESCKYFVTPLKEFPAVNKRLYDYLGERYNLIEGGENGFIFELSEK